MSLVSRQQRNEIHVAVSTEVAHQLVGTWAKAGIQPVRVRIAGAMGYMGLVDRLSRSFHFPYRVTSLDAALDLMSEPSWLGDRPGYVVVIEDTDKAEPHVLAGLAGISPYVIDRARSAGLWYVILFMGSSHRIPVLYGLLRANEELQEAAREPWDIDTQEATIVDHASQF